VILPEIRFQALGQDSLRCHDEPVDAVLRDEADLKRLTRVDEILADLQQAKNLRILVLDSCRDNPFAEDLKRSLGRSRSAAFSRGLAKMESPTGPSYLMRRRQDERLMMGQAETVHTPAHF